MFSPVDPTANQKSPSGPLKPSGSSFPGPRYTAIASPVSSLPPNSPYSPAAGCRAGGPSNRLSSTDSTKTFSSSGSTSGNYLADSLAEFQELQAKIKFEQDAQSQQQPPPPAYPQLQQQQETKATIQVKIEPMDLLSGSFSGHNSELKRVSMDSNSSGGSNFGFDAVAGLQSSLPPPPAYSEGVRQLRGHLHHQEDLEDPQQQQHSNVQVKMEPVLSLAMAQVKNDISNACRQLGIQAGN